MGNRVENRVGLVGKLVVAGRLALAGGAVAAPAAVIACGGNGPDASTIAPTTTSIETTSTPSQTAEVTLIPTEVPTPEATPVENPKVEFSQIQESITTAYSSIGEEIPEYLRTKMDHCNGQNLPEDGNVTPNFAAGACQQVGAELRDKFRQTQNNALLAPLSQVEQFYNQQVDQLVKDGIYLPEISESEKQNAKIQFFTP